MAAPSGIVWGSVAGSGNYLARIGIYVKLTSTATETTRHTEIWFWSKYSVIDATNSFYYDDNASSATTSKGSVDITTTVSTGSGWSTTNQVKIASYDYTFTKGTSASTRSVAAKLTGINVISGTMTATTTYTIPALASYTVKYNANGGTGAPGNQTKTYGVALTLSNTKPTRTGYTFQGWATSASGSVSYAAGASYTKNAAVTLYAIWKANTYTVKYDDNGGSGQPSSQTKTYGVALTLSNTKPTRTGYTFQGWATSASGSVVYAAGASYTSNAAVTLYAVWKANTYTVKYDANGGTGAPGNQTKTYGVALTLSNTKPTRTNYTFKGWGTSASATTVSYAAGASYTSNAAATLYAIWELAYTKPRITSYSVSRCDANGVLSDSGTCARVKFNWACDKAVSSIRIDWKFASGAGYKTVTASGTSGSVNEIVGNGNISTDLTYTVTVTVTDSGGFSNANKTLHGLKFPIDCLPENKGIAFGKPAEAEFENYADFNYKSFHRESSEYTVGKAVRGRASDGNIYSALIPITDSGNLSLGYGLYSAKLAATHIYGNRINMYSRDDIHTNGSNVVFKDDGSIFGTKPDGTVAEALNPQNDSGNTVLGYGNYLAQSGNTNIYGHDIHFCVSNIATPSSYRPYRRRGDSLTLTLRTTGYVTNSGKDVSFWIPIAVPIFGAPTVTITSGNGFVFRQGTKYTHGSAAETYATPTSYEAAITTFNGIYVKAVFSDTTNVTNNDAIGIYWNGTITFS